MPYNEAIGSALWPVVMSCPDAAFAIGVLSQFIQNPGPAHWEGLKWVINYLGCTRNLWLTSALNIQVFILFWDGSSILELKETECDSTLEYRGQVHHADAHSKESHVALKFYQ